MGAAQNLLDSVQSLAKLRGFTDDPHRYAELVAAEAPAAVTLPELSARDAAWRAAFAAIDQMIERAMRLEMDFAPDIERTIPLPTRKVFAGTITSYAGRIGLLAERARDTAARVTPSADHIADLVTEAAERVLALRAVLYTEVLEVVRATAAASAVEADRQARDRRLDDKLRKAWSAARRVLEGLVAEPPRILAAAWEARIAAEPEMIDEPDPEKEPTFADMIEMD